MKEILLIFTALTIINVVLSTAKSLITIKGGMWAAAFMNAFTYGVYTYLVFFTADDTLTLWQKAIITFICNFIGVLLVKWIEQKATKDKLWVFLATAKTDLAELHKVDEMLKQAGIKLLYNEVVKDELYSLQIFSNTQKESKMIESVLENFNIQYCAVETKMKKSVEKAEKVEVSEF